MKAIWRNPLYNLGRFYIPRNLPLMAAAGLTISAKMNAPLDHLVQNIEAITTPTPVACVTGAGSAALWVALVRAGQGAMAANLQTAIRQHNRTLAIGTVYGAIMALNITGPSTFVPVVLGAGLTYAINKINAPKGWIPLPKHYFSRRPQLKLAL